MEKLKKQIEFLKEIDKLKEIFRQSLLADNSRHENDAEHSWHLAMFCIILGEYAPDGTDILKCIKLVLIHDLVEIYAGDTYLYDEKGNADKADREKAAADKLFSILPSHQEKEIYSLWNEFEERKTEESIFANMLDRLQPIMLNYLTEGKMWIKNGVKKSQVLEKAMNMGFSQGNEKLQKYLLSLLDECVEKGYLING
ncbi:MAG: HD domain-containing protein [Firmicutes bacterium]|nr:HD domain-containing protein [Bacillota bacterium]